jgi:hypothetical protein
MGRYLSAKETNTRYMALEALCNMTGLESAREAINKYQETVVQALKVHVGWGQGGVNMYQIEVWGW